MTGWPCLLPHLHTMHLCREQPHRQSREEPEYKPERVLWSLEKEECVCGKTCDEVSFFDDLLLKALCSSNSAFWVMSGATSFPLRSARLIQWLGMPVSVDAELPSSQGKRKFNCSHDWKKMVTYPFHLRDSDLLYFSL